jgi:hypothetical protein
MKNKLKSVGSVPSGMEAVEPVESPHCPNILLSNPEKLLNIGALLQAFRSPSASEVGLKANINSLRARDFNVLWQDPAALNIAD